MSRELNMDTQRQNFWKEAIFKEAYVRLAWHKRYQNEVQEKQAKSSEDDEASRANRTERFTGMVPKIPQGTRILPIITYPKKPKPKSEMIAKRLSKSSLDPDSLLTEMRPVTPNVRRILYHGFTKEGKGRYKYLHTRAFKKPEDKYAYPLTTSWEYGWKLDDVVTEFRSPQYGRSRIVRDTFFRRNGIMYDPVSA